MSADENDETAENMPGGGGQHANTMNLSGKWSRFAGLPAFMSIKNWRRIYTDNQAQSSLFLAVENGGKSLERQKANQRRQATMAGFQPFFALFPISVPQPGNCTTHQKSAFWPGSVLMSGI